VKVSADARSEPAAPEPSPGVALSRLRRKAGLTGEQLGRMVRMSQAKISRIETGATVASPADVGRIARALGATRDVVDTLTEQAEQAQNRLTDWRLTAGTVSSIQREVARIEADTREFRVFQPTIVFGLAQTSEYARAVLAAVYESRLPANREAQFTVVPEAVSARMRRQEVLAEPGRRFYFLMTESVLTNRIVDPVYMLAQIERLRQVAAPANVSLKIIPTEATLALPPFHGFEVLDDKCAMVDAFNTSMVTRGREDIRFYRHVFDTLDENATADIAPILNRHRRIYRDLTD
jgi:transcriptional regulator with XRE-family HTH domain